MFAFDPEAHRYTLDGAELPSITQVMRAVRVLRPDQTWGAWFNYDFLSAERSDEVMQRGRWIHDLVALRLTRGALSPSLLEAAQAEAPAWFVYYPVFERWLERVMANGFSPLIVEQPLFSARYRFAGTPDLVCILNGQRPSIIDFKTNSAPSEASVQTAAQAILLEDQEGYAYRQQPHDRYALELPAQGEARLIPHRNHIQDRNLFLAALQLFHHHCPNGERSKGA